MAAGGEGAFQSITYGTFFTNESDDACMLSLDLARRLSAAIQKEPLSGAGPKELLGKTLTFTYAARSEAAARAAVPLPPGLDLGR
jgi:hypothetical protein